LAVAKTLFEKRPAILDKIPVCAWSGRGMDEWSTWELIVISMADTLEDIDQSFNRINFLYVCGLVEDEKKPAYVILERAEIAYTLGLKK
jgi:hypothetical protein